MFFQRTDTIFELNSRIYETNVLNKFHEDWTKNVTSKTIFELFHDDWALIVTSRVFTRKTATPTGGHVFIRTGTSCVLNQPIIKTNIFTNFELDRVIIGTNLLTKFHEDRTRNEASRVFTRFLYCQMKETALPTGGHVFQLTGTTFNSTNISLRQTYIIGTNLLTRFHEGRTRNVASRVFTKKTATPTDGHFLNGPEPLLTSFELDRSIIGANLLTKFYEDRTRHVATRVFTNKCGRRTDGRTTDKDRSQKLT
ncbi:hypothetical protein DPMN_126687 [Dreissena polymorpha]|uniref:Uncharacterized protein n=1 Tax=Dreissena polymorpha TaxID=45954 RepID=A0A9D4H0L2_DREPO|nr:hypothetical protein DPMN_126687 [Dreissena polymorpha]